MPAKVDLELGDHHTGFLARSRSGGIGSRRVPMSMSALSLVPFPLLLAHLARFLRARQVRVGPLQLSREPASICGKECTRLHELGVNLRALA